jgi:MYXO-CTERM domain-containing protein
VTLSAIRVATPEDGLSTVSQGLGYPGAIWNPASSSNYQNANRTADDLYYIIIHTTQGSYGGTINWFQNPAAEVSSHYVVRSSDGEITQMVDDRDIAWHIACFNAHSIGIEHEGFVDDPGTWYTEAMYSESARLTAWLADTYAIPKDRAHIMGHGEAPDCSDHTDPGPGWDWAHYMDLVATGGQPQFGADAATSDYPATMTAGEDGVAYFELVNRSNVTWGIDETRLGTQEPQDRDSAFFVDGNWLAPNRATGADHSSYGPGSTGRFTFAIHAPEVTEPTTFDEAFQLVQEGVTWFGPIVHMTITVLPRTGGGDEGGGDPGLGGNPGLDGDTADDPGTSGGCSAGGGGGSGAAVLVLGALLAVRRRQIR